ncbi:MAG: hypothetical protein Q8R76_00375 [Candidatus Omnitrophota bacterium]|nr:hypothetical protein [Candidatus Omnitrophota bacterium]
MRAFSLLMLVAVLVFGSVSVGYAADAYDEGYVWAEENDVTDINYNEGSSDDFNEGVRDYVAERLAEQEWSDEGMQADEDMQTEE